MATRPPHHVGDTWTDDDPTATGSHVGADRYEERATLGEGGLGRVTAVFDRVLAREVARKDLLAERPTSRRRFLREARLTAQLEHPNIVPVHDAGEDQDGRPFYIMKRVEGRSLQQAIDAAPTLAQRLDLLDHVVDACQAVAYAHARGVLHRDLKPDNLMIGRFGETWVVDWGLAVADGTLGSEPGSDPANPAEERISQDESLTQVGAVVGTPAFMSPEQARGQRVDVRSDVWSLGATLFMLVAGRPPVQGGGGKAVLQRVAAGPLPPVRTVVPELPVELAAVIDRALRFDADERYADAGALAADLRAWQAGHRVGAYDYSVGELGSLLVQQHWPALVVGTAVLGLIGVVAAAGVFGIQRQRDQAQANYAALASSYASQLFERDALPPARLLAAESLAIAESPEARGLLAATSATDGAVLEFKAAGPTCRDLALSPDGRNLACAGPDGLTVWHRDEVSWRADGGLAVAWSLDDGRLAVALEDSVEVRDGPTGEVLQTWSAHHARELAWTRTGEVVWLDALQGWLVVDGQRVGEERVCSGVAMPLDAATGADRVAVACIAGQVRVFDSTTWSLVDAYDIGEATYSIQLSADGGRLLVSGRERVVTVELGAAGPADNHVVREVAVSAGGLVVDARAHAGSGLVVTGEQGLVTLYDDAGDRVAQWSGREAPSRTVSSGRQLWMGVQGGGIERWSVGTTRPDRMLAEAIRLVAYPSRDRLVVLEPHQVQLVTLSSFSQLAVVPRPTPDAELVAAALVGDQLTLVTRKGEWWRGRVGTEPGSWEHGALWQASRWTGGGVFTADGELVVLQRPHDVSVIELVAAGDTRVASHTLEAVVGGVVSDRGQVVVLSSDADELLRVGTPVGAQGLVFSAAAGARRSPQGIRADVDLIGEVELEWPDGRQRTLQIPHARQLAWAGHRLLVITSDRALQVRDPETLELEALLPGLRTRVGQLLVVGDEVIASEWGPTVRRWSLAALDADPAALRAGAREAMGLGPDEPLDVLDWD